MGDYKLKTQVVTSKENSGIGIYSNQENVLALTVNNSEITLFKVEKGVREILFKENMEIETPVLLKYECTDGRYYKFYWSANEKDWTPIKIDNSYQFNASFIAQWGFSPRIGFIIDGKVESMATYSFLKIDYKNE